RLSTARTCLSPSVTSTIFAPAARHFVVHASPLALAPLAPHLSSATQPLTVVLLPMSSNAIAPRANTKQNARQTTSTFFMVDSSPFEYSGRDRAPRVEYLSLSYDHAVGKAPTNRGLRRNR